MPDTLSLRHATRERRTVNPIEQKTHTRVTTEIARDLQALTEEWREEFTAACDRLDAHMRQIDENRRTGVDLRLELSRLADIVSRLSRATGDAIAPLKRDTLKGRLRWLWTGK